MCLENIHDSGHSEERPLTKSADGMISEHSPQSVPWHQISKKSANYQTGWFCCYPEKQATTPNADPATQEIRPLPCSWPQDDKDGSQPIAYIRSSEFRRKDIENSETHLSPSSSPLYYRVKIRAFVLLFKVYAFCHLFPYSIVRKPKKCLRLKVKNELRLCWVLLKGFRTTVSPAAVE
ncbi:hypothetical protein ACS0TY_014776 [Phlomoides rotata]